MATGSGAKAIWSGRHAAVRLMLKQRANFLTFVTN